MKPASDVVIALRNIMERNSTVVAPIERSKGRINTMGDRLEYFMKDMFSPGNRAAQHPYEKDKKREYDKYLSWDGDNRYFPDFIIKGGVGVEPKKSESKSFSALSLNSSYPKKYITPLTQNLPPLDCIKEGKWDKKDVVYAIGNIPKEEEKSGKLKYLWMFYSNTYIADPSIYENLISNVRGALAGLPGNMKLDSKELGRVHGVDPLGVSNLRVRGMYEMKHPAKIFETALKNFGINFPDSATKIYVAIRKSDYEKLGCLVDLGDANHDLSQYFEERRLVRLETSVKDPDGRGDIDIFLFVGYTE